MFSKQTRIIGQTIWILLLLLQASCGAMETPQEAVEADAPATSRPPIVNRVLDESLPEICNCILRFDMIGIEEGLSQSSVHTIFQDSRGFLWFGTEDGLNRYDGYTFKVYKHDPDNEASISDGWINAIAEDQNGYLWIGTRLGGLNRYDPLTDEFTTYQHVRSEETSLIDNHVLSLLVDNKNQLWVGTTNGLDRFNPATQTFVHYSYIDPATAENNASEPSNPSDIPGKDTKTEKISSRIITTLYQDSLGRIWIGTYDSGLIHFDSNSNLFTIYQHVDNRPTSISSNRVKAITEAKGGDLWVGTQQGLDLFKPESGQFKSFTHDDDNPTSIIYDSVNALMTDAAGNLWIGTDNGLDRLAKDGTRFIHYQNDPSFPRSLSSNVVTSIYEDLGGVLWFGTYGAGVNKYDRARNSFAYYRNNPKDPASLSSNFIFPIYGSKDGYAWIGTLGEGLNRFNWRTGKNVRLFSDPDNPNSLSSNWVISLFEDSQGILWIGTNKGLDRFDSANNNFQHFRHDGDNPNSLSADLVYSLYEDSKGNLWVGTSAGLDRFDRKTRKFTHFKPNTEDSNSLSGVKPYAIMEDQDGYLWVGTSDSGLNRFDPQTQTFKQYHHDPEIRDSLNSDSVLSIYQDSKGRLWVGTAGAGLNLYQPETDSFTHYVEKDGLPNGFIYGILEDDLGRLWMSSNFGISRFDPDTERFRNFDSGDGLQSNEFNSSAYAKGMDGEFYFGGVNGLTVFRPSEITDSQYLPPIALTSLDQEDQSIATATSVETVKSITLTYPQNSFEFEFAALSYNQPGKNQYAYTLEGFDSNWHFIGEKRNGRYTNLPGGTYTLLLKAANSDGVWNETPTRLSVTVVPPFWEMTWFRLLLGLVAVLAVAGGVRLRTKNIQDRNRQLERLVRERTNALEIRNQEIQALYQADERILRNVSLQQVFQTLVDVAVDTLNADRSVVFAWDEKHTKVVPRVSRGFSAETLKRLQFAKGEGVVGKVLETGETAVVRQIELNDFRADIREAIIAEGIRSFVHLPIIVDHKIVGVFNIGFTKPNLIGDDTARLFSALTQRASLSIANMELFEQTKDLAVMEERNRLARDLHDSAKQKAFAALAQLGTARGILNGNGNSVSLHLNEAENLVSDVIQELTFLVQEIYPIALQEKGLATALRDYIYEWENRNDAAAQLITRNDRRLPLETEQALYRVTQEALANVARHSRARRVDVSLVYNSDSIQLSLSDDGCGFDTGVKSYGMGLRSMRERVSSIHGTLQIQSAPGHGVRILVQAPIKN